MLDRSENEGSQIKWWLDMRITLLQIILLFTLNLLQGCGAKSKVVQKEVRTQKNDIVVHETENIHTDINVKTLLKNIIIEPIDESMQHSVSIISKPDTLTVIGNNAKVLLKKETTDSVATTTQKKDSSVVDKSQIEKKEVNKNIESEGWNWRGLNAFLFLIIALIVIWYFLGKRR